MLWQWWLLLATTIREPSAVPRRGCAAELLLSLSAVFKQIEGIFKYGWVFFFFYLFLLKKAELPSGL